MSQPSETFHGGRPVPADELRRRSSGVRPGGRVFEVKTAAATTAYGGELRIPVHPMAGSVSSMGVSYKLGPREKSREFVLPISECGLSVVQGTGKIRIGDEEHDFAVGDLAFIPVQGKFAIENTGDEPMVMVGLISPPDANILRTAGLWME